MKVENMSIKLLKEYEKNPRDNKKAIDKVAQSIKEFGFRNPILVDQKMEIIAGHTRYRASLKLELKEVPVIVLEDLSEDQIRAFRIADNKVSEYAKWDQDLLAEELESLDQAQYNLTLTGFDIEEINELLANNTFSNPLYDDTLEDLESPEEFEEYDEKLETEYRCPKCNYEWSGKKR